MPFQLTVDLDNSNCPFCLKCKNFYLSGELIPQGMCLLAFQAIYPYYLTLINGGWFKWVRPKDGVIVQCPNPDGALEMKIFLCDSKQAVRVEVLRSRGECSKGHKKGDVFILDSSALKFCPKALGAFIPYFILFAKGEQLPWKNSDGKTVLICPHASCGSAKFILVKTKNKHIIQESIK